MPQNRLVVLLCGLPASGKTSTAREFAKQFRELQDRESMILSFDDRQVDPSEWDSTTFRASRSASLQCLEFELDAAHPPDKVFIVDDIMYLKSMRRQVYIIGRNRCVPVAVVSVEVDLPTALARNDQRPPQERVTQSAVVKIHSSFERPKNNTADKLHFSIDNSRSTEESNVQREVREIILKLSYLAPLRAAELAVANEDSSCDKMASNMNNIQLTQHRIQQLDLWLRSEIATIMRDLSTSLQDVKRKRVGAALSRAKQTILTKARSVETTSPTSELDHELREILLRAAAEGAEE